MVVKNTSQIIIDLYRKRAGNYDISANLYYLIGFREQKYRKMAVDFAFFINFRATYSVSFHKLQTQFDFY